MMRLLRRETFEEIHTGDSITDIHGRTYTFVGIVSPPTAIGNNGTGPSTGRISVIDNDGVSQQPHPFAFSLMIAES